MSTEGSTDAAAAERARKATSGLVRRVLIGAVLGAFVFAGFSLYADVDALRHNLSRFAWPSFGLAVILATANYALRYVRWQYYLTQLDVRVPHGTSALIFLSGFVMSVTPGKLGEVLKSLLLYEERGVSIARTAPVVIAERLTDLIALVLLTAVGSLAFEGGAPIAAVGAGAAGFVLLACSVRAIGELLLGIAARLPLIRRIEPRLREAYESLYLLSRPAPLGLATALATASWFLECVALWVIVSGLDAPPLSLAASSFAYAASTVVGALAMMPGGLGVTEAGMTGLITSLSDGTIDTSAATAATLLCRLATLWWAVVVGAVALAWLRARKASSRA
ncbi:MAG: YbhN family protein [Sandaracinaceae bacterium]